MAITGIFFGSDTGNTENIAKMIQKQLGKDVADVHDIAKSSKEDLEAYDILLLGIPTWYYGEAVRYGSYCATPPARSAPRQLPRSASVRHA